MNHPKNFADPDSGAHTNTIEGLWALVKKKLKAMSGTLYKHLPNYFDEFVWFRKFRVTEYSRSYCKTSLSSFLCSR